MFRILTYILAMGLTVYVGVIYSSEPLLFLFLTELCFLLLDGAFFLYQRRKCSVLLTLPLPVAERGQRIPVELALKNTGGFLSAKADILLEYRRFPKGKKRVLKLSGFFESKREVQLSAHIESFESGCYDFEAAKIKLYDPLSLFFVRKRFALSQRLDIIPPIYATGVLVSERVRHFQGDSDIYDSLRGGDDASETFQIREFRKGDKLKDIHWKLSAKEEAWIVRENGQPLACAVVLFLDFSAEGKRAAGNMEDMISLAASISFALAEAKCPHYIAWYAKKEQELVRVRVDDEEGLYFFLNRMFAEDVSREARDLKSEYRERYKGEEYVTDIYVNQGLTLSVRGEEVWTCLPERMKEELAELVINV